MSHLFQRYQLCERVSKGTWTFEKDRVYSLRRIFFKSPCRCVMDDTVAVCFFAVHLRRAIASCTQKIAALNSYLNMLEGIEAIDPMWLIAIEDGPVFRFEKINKSFTDVTGLPASRVVGLTIEEVLPQTSHALVREKYSEAISTKKIVDYVEVAMHPAGEKVGEIRVIPIKNESGVVVKIVGIAHDVTEIVALQKKLAREREERSKQITAAVIRSQEAERNNISRELHDNINQVLTTVKLYTELCQAKTVDADVYLPRCTTLLNETISEIRNLSKQLASPAFNLGLAESIKDLVESVQQTQQADIDLHVLPDQCQRVDDDLQLAIYRIAQEQLTNVLKHAQASRITVNLHCTENELLLSIADNGVGFDTRKKTRGIGISNIYSRASLFNGQVDLTSAQGQGCALSVRFPLLQNKAAS